MLVDSEIRKAVAVGDIQIVPFDSEHLQPVSYDLALFDDIRVPDPAFRLMDIGPGRDFTRDPSGRSYGLREIPAHHTLPCTIQPEGWDLKPGDFILACTDEYVKLTPTMAARVEGKSSLGRLGMAVHITAGFIDPGFQGQITLEIANLAPWTIRLYPGMPIAQIVFESVSTPDRDYSQTGHYNGQRGPTESRYRFRG